MALVVEPSSLSTIAFKAYTIDTNVIRSIYFPHCHSIVGNMPGPLSYLLHALAAFGGQKRSERSMRSHYFDLAARMIESNVERGQLSPSNESSAFIEQASVARINDSKPSPADTHRVGHLSKCAPRSHRCHRRCDTSRSMAGIPID